MDFLKSKPKEKPKEPLTAPQYQQLCDAIVELSNEIGNLKMQISRINGQSGGRPKKLPTNGLDPGSILQEFPDKVILKNGVIIMKGIENGRQ